MDQRGNRMPPDRLRREASRAGEANVDFPTMCRHQLVAHHHLPKLIPVPPTTPILAPPHPRGAAIRKASRWWGWARRLRAGLHPALGRLRGTALGVLRPLCEELAGKVLGITPSSHAGRRDNPMRGTGARGLAAEAGPRPDKRGPEPKIADRRSATGRAAGGSIPPRRILAQRMRIICYAPRGAPLPLVFDACVRAWAGISAVRFRGRARTPPPCGEGQGWGSESQARRGEGGGLSMPVRQSLTQRGAPHPFPSPQGGGVCDAVPVRRRPVRPGARPV